MNKHSALIFGAVLLPAATGASAQDSNDLRVRVGLGAQVRPKFVGADNSEIAPLVNVKIARGNTPFRFSAPTDSLGIPVISSGGFSFGPAANIAGSRKEKDVGADLGKVKTTLEVGAFAEQYLTDSFRVRAELMKGVNGHKGIVGSLSADQIWRDGDKYVLSIGPHVRFSDGRYQRAYFGVTPAAALATDLPEYRPSGGVHTIGLEGTARVQFNPALGLFSFASYDRLAGDAAKSPIVRELGSRNQLSAGLGLSYTFVIRR